MIDLRSDTVTRPTKAQRQAAFDAVVGDDVMQDDQTVKELETYCARLLGHEAALYVCSGCMGNLTCLLVHTSQVRDSEIIVGQGQHIYKYEQGSYARFGGIASLVLPNQPDGTLDLTAIRSSIRNHADVHMPKSQVLCLENTHNTCGGVVLSLNYMKQARQLADENGMKIHLDGARLMNASVASGIPMSEYGKLVDSVSFCLSKGIGAPIGSVIAGSRGFIEEARRVRKSLGGGWRQAGFIAACALTALQDAPERLTKDHEHAQRVYQAISKLPLFAGTQRPHTNIVNVMIAGVESEKIVKLLEEDNDCGEPVLVFALTPTSVRLVMHSDVTTAQINAAIEKLKKLSAKLT